MRPPTILGVIFVVAGIAHFVRPAPFEQIVPPPLPAERGLVYLSGLGELVCAFGLFRGHRWARTASVALLAAVFPANIWMAIDAWQSDHSAAYRLATVARLPLQAVLVRMALWTDDEIPPSVPPGP